MTWVWTLTVAALAAAPVAKDVVVPTAPAASPLEQGPEGLTVWAEDGRAWPVTARGLGTPSTARDRGPAAAAPPPAPEGCVALDVPHVSLSTSSVRAGVVRCDGALRVVVGEGATARRLTFDGLVGDVDAAVARVSDDAVVAVVVSGDRVRRMRWAREAVGGPGWTTRWIPGADPVAWPSAVEAQAPAARLDLRIAGDGPVLGVGLHDGRLAVVRSTPDGAGTRVAIVDVGG